MPVHGNRDQPRPGGFQRPSGGGIAGVFHPGGIAGPEHRAQAKLQALLRAADQHDLARVATHAPADGEVLRHARAQFLAATGVAVSEVDGIERPQALAKRAPQAVQEQGVNACPA